MDKMILNILGCGSASPTLRHNTSCQIIDYRGALYMIDCGEGAQLQMMRMGLSAHKLTDIFLSHLHGDHCLGLIPLLSTMGLHQKGGKVTIHTSAEGERVLKPIIDYFVGPVDFTISFNTVDPLQPNRLLETRGLTVESFPLYHRVPTMGFLFRERPKPRHLKGDMADFYKIPPYRRTAIKNGEDYVTPEGKVIANHLLTTDPSPSTSYAYCSDTIRSERVAKAVAGVANIYHEATYEAANKLKARHRGHSSADEAAEIAVKAGAKRLILGHFSKAADEKKILLEAQEIFPNTILAYEGLKLEL